MLTGLQLYNFRNELAKDFAGTMREIAKLGFDSVEFAGGAHANMEPDELAAFLKELKLRCAGTMFSADKLLNEQDKVYEYAVKLQSPAVTISSNVDFAKLWPDIAKTCAAIGDIAAKHPGLVFSYHNHWMEFATAGDKSAMEQILDATDAQKVFWEPDLCWLSRAKQDPMALLPRYGARIRQIHLKDIVEPEVPETTSPLGKGTLNLQRCLEAAKKTQAQFIIYEQDFCDDPFQCAADSLKFLKANL